MEYQSGEVILAIELLVLVSTVAILVKYIRLPYTLALVTAGLGLGFANMLPDIQLTPKLVFAVILPALLFEAAINLDLRSLKDNLKPIVAFAVFGLIVAVPATAGLISLLLDIPFSTALLFGALISATDPISVLSFFKKFNVNKDLTMIIEGEALFNDGTAVTAFVVAIALVLKGGEFSAVDGVRTFLFVAVGGLVLGALMGYLGSKIVARVDDHLIEITLSTILAYGTYLAADKLHVSGVMAVIAAGLVFGNHGIKYGMSSTTKVTLFSFWEYIGFIVNSIVFLLIGTQVKVADFASYIQPVVIAFLVVFVVRAMVIYLFSWILGIIGRKIPYRWQFIIFWSGLRGAISMALVMAIPFTVPDKEMLIFMTFGTVLLSLFIKGATMKYFLKKFGFFEVSDEKERYQRIVGDLVAKEKALEEIERMRNDHLITEGLYNEFRANYSAKFKEIEDSLVKLSLCSVDHEEQFRMAGKRIMESQKIAVYEAFIQGLISDDVYRELTVKFDRELESIKSADPCATEDVKPEAGNAGGPAVSENRDDSGEARGG